MSTATTFATTVTCLPAAAPGFAPRGRAVPGFAFGAFGNPVAALLQFQRQGLLVLGDDLVAYLDLIEVAHFVPHREIEHPALESPST
ncbi:hypothetical protein ACU4GD_16680 [Cupriavidus basilensis]